MTPEKRETAIKWLTEEVRSLRMAPKINGCGPENWADLLEIMETCLEAVRSDFVDTNKMVPLTVEQLREMDGKPVWIVEQPDWGHWELSEDAEDYLCDRDTGLYGLTYPDPDGKRWLNQLGWIAYAYPPAHIDREAWEPCWVCGQYEVLGFRGWRRQENMLKPPDGFGGCMYCPHCGRPRNEKAWAQLEQRLRGVPNGQT